MSFGDDTLDPANRDQTTRARPAVLASEAALDRIAEAVGYPDRFAHREVGESSTMHRARAVSNALVYDNEELCGMGLGTGLPISFTRAREADGATQEFTAAEQADAAGQPVFTSMRIPAAEPVTYSWRLPQLSLTAALSLSLSVVAFVLALIALVF